MKIETVIRLGEASAQYIISKEPNGCFKAELHQISGNPECKPPKEIVLLRGARNWTGSTNDQTVLDELGQAIESLINEAPIFSEEDIKKKRSRTINE